MNDLLDALEQAVDREEWLIALDRDGTLVPYADRPEQACVDERLRLLMDRLNAAGGFRVAIVSARSAAQLQGDFFGQELILAGNYGMEIRFPDGNTVVQPQALAAVPDLKEFRDELAGALGLSGGSILEDHGYSLCLHWHKVKAADLDQLHSVVQEMSLRFASLSIRRLPTSYEVLPNIVWDKGRAIEFIDENTARRHERFYFYGGDSEADTPAFRWVNARNGISVRVGPKSNLEARFRVDEPAQLHVALDYLTSRRRSQPAA